MAAGIVGGVLVGAATTVLAAATAPVTLVGGAVGIAAGAHLGFFTGQAITEAC